MALDHYLNQVFSAAAPLCGSHDGQWSFTWCFGKRMRGREEGGTGEEGGWWRPTETLMRGTHSQSSGGGALA